MSCSLLVLLMLTFMSVSAFNLKGPKLFTLYKRLFTIQSTSYKHPRNKHQNRYDIDSLVESLPQLLKCVIKSPSGEKTIDMSNQESVRLLNSALLLKYYNIKDWKFSYEFLTPPIPSRVEYVHYLADVIGYDYFTKNKNISGMDIGCGSSCIYPLLFNAEYKIKMVGVDIDNNSLLNAKKILQSNNLCDSIDLRLQPTPADIYNHHVIKNNEKFLFSMCNPPFYDSIDDAERASERKWKHLGKGSKKSSRQFGGTSNELVCPGGDLGFVSKMIQQSLNYKNQILYFSALVSQEKHMSKLCQALEAIRANGVYVEFSTIEFNPGQKKSRILVWSFVENKAVWLNQL